MTPKLRRVGWMAAFALPMALAASESAAPDTIELAARASPNFTAEQRLAMARAHQAREHPMWRELTPTERVARFAMFGRRLARSAIAAATGEGASPVAAPFQGNLTLIQGASGKTIALQRQADCSLSYLVGSYTLSLTSPTVEVQGSTANYQDVLRSAAGLALQTGQFARGCAEPSLGIGSRRGVYLGRTRDALYLFAASGYNYAVASNALYYGTIDPLTQTVKSFNTDVSVPELGALAVGDLDGDGQSDLVGIDRFVGSIAVWKVRADGSIGAPTRYALPGSRTNAVVLADVNGDGKVDVVAATADESNQEVVSVLNGRGDGTLDAARPVNVSTPSGVFGAQVVNLVAADLRGNGRPDIVGSNGLVMLNDGSGNFTQGGWAFAASTATSAFGPNLAVADFDEDGKLDVVVNNGLTIDIQLGRGDGSFRAGRRYASNDSVGYMTATDLDGDGHVDLYVGLANGGFFGGDQFSVRQAYALIGNGDGSLRGAPLLPFVFNGRNMVDLNGDGILDAVGVNADRSFTTYLGDARGGFTAQGTLSASPLRVGAEQFTLNDIDSLALADINGDGHKDLIFRAKDFVARGPTGFYTAGLLVALGDASGNFATPSFLPAPSFLLPGDIDIDPKQSNLRAADINGDGKSDLIYGYSVSSFDTNTFQRGTAVQLGNGDGTFQPPKTMVFFSGPANVSSFLSANVQQIADLNGDGRPDLIFVTMLPTRDSNLGGNRATVQVALGTGDGSFSAPTDVAGPELMATYFGQASAAPIALADMNGDGVSDMVVLGGSGSYSLQIAVVLGKGDGSFRAPILTTLPGQYLFSDLGVAVGDFNADGKPDVVVVDPFIGSNGGISFGNGDGTLRSLTTGVGTAVRHNLSIDIPVGGASTVLDLNNDGKPDVIAGQTLLLSAARDTVAPNTFVLDGSGVPVRPGRNRSFTARPPAPIAEYPVSNVKRPFGRLVVE
jgi:hypothetical protein